MRPSLRSASESHPLGSRGLTGAYVMPCVPGNAAEVFAWNSTVDGYILSALGGTDGCLTTCACETGCLQFWECGQGGCGTPGQSYQWSMPPGGGALANAAYPPGSVLTYADGVLSIAPDSGADGQVWAFDAAAGQFALPRLGLCLSAAPVPSDVVFAQACLRTAGAWPWTSPMPGYCLQVFHNGTWAVVAAEDTLASGIVPVTPFDPAQQHELRIAAAGSSITAALDGLQLAAVTDTQFASGSAALGGGWHPISVDRITVAPAALTCE
jgi:hypothetical protein